MAINTKASFIKDEFHGEGVYYRASGSELRGCFKYGEYIGSCADVTPALPITKNNE